MTLEETIPIDEEGAKNNAALAARAKKSGSPFATDPVALARAA